MQQGFSSPSTVSRQVPWKRLLAVWFSATVSSPLQVETANKNNLGNLSFADAFEERNISWVSFLKPGLDSRERRYEEVEQRAAVDADAEEPRGEVLVLQTKERSTERRATGERRDPSGAGEQGRKQLELVEHGEARRLEEDPRADRAGLSRALVHRDAMPRAREKRACCGARKAAADDGYVQFFLHTSSAALSGARS